jgi:LmbE family N-acetylglucosaminyl deacetylase
VVSPHLDDAVFGCGQLIASHPGCTVLTVFAGLPLTDTGLTPYDARCGFSSSTQAMQIRLAEDCRALAFLGAHPLRMNELDSQYAPLPEPLVLADRLWHMLAKNEAGHWDAIIVPLGLFHCDHVCVSDACLHLVRQHSETLWIGYENVLYRRRAGVLQQRLAILWAAGVMATPITLQGVAAVAHLMDEASRAVPAYLADSPSQKACAVACYASQLKCLGMSAGGDDGTNEAYWLLNIENMP